MATLRSRWVTLVVAMLVLLSLPVQDALAWGAKGHRLTALIAEQLLSPTARLRLKAILGTGDLAAAALYLDIHKDELEKTVKGSRQWHFDDRPTCDADEPKVDYCPGGNCASVQLKRQYGILINPESSTADKRFAIRVIAHLAGDIHQPLHASDHDDSGGNAIKVLGNWSGGKKANLHSVWDNDFVSKAFEGGDYKNKTEGQIATMLVEQITAAEREAWRKGRIASWLNESYEKAVNVAYGRLPNFACSVEDFADKPVTLDDEYIANAVLTVPDQLKRGGVRLAAILNRALDPNPSEAGFVRAGSL